MNKITFINRTPFSVTVSHGSTKIKLHPNYVQNDDWLILPNGTTEIQIKLHLWGLLLKNRTETISLDTDSQDTCYKISFDQESWEYFGQMNRLILSELLTIVGMAIFGMSFLSVDFIEGGVIGYLTILLINLAYHTKNLKSYLKQKEQIISIEKSL